MDLRKEKEEVSASLQERHSEVSALSQKLVDREGKVTQLEDSCNNLTQQVLFDTRHIHVDNNCFMLTISAHSWPN